MRSRRTIVPCLVAIAPLSAACSGSPSGAPTTTGGRSSTTSSGGSTPTPSASSASAYAAGLQRAYLPVSDALAGVTAACVRSDMRLALLPARGRQVRTFRTNLARFAAFLRRVSPPPEAGAAVAAVVRAISAMERQFVLLAARIRHLDLAGFLAMGGLHRPLDRSINAFFRAILALHAVVPQAFLPTG